MDGGFDSVKFPSEEMKFAIARYIQYVWGIRYNSTLYGIEETVQISPEIGHGTVDFWALEGDILHVCDLKYGKSRVFAEMNPQLMLYAYGLYMGNNVECTKVHLHIIQPRVNKYGVTDMWETSIYDIIKWIRETVLQAITQINKGKIEFCPGGWCYFCPGRGQCPESDKYTIKKYEEDEPMNGTGKMTTAPMKCVYVALASKVPRIKGSKELEYQLTLLIPKDDHETIDNLKVCHEEAYTKGIKSKWGGKPTDGKWEMETLLKESDELWAEGCYTFKIKSTADEMPIFTPDKKRMEPDEIAKLKSGDIFRVCLQLSPYNNMQYKTKGIGGYLISVMLIEHGEYIPVGGQGENPLLDFE